MTKKLEDLLNLPDAQGAIKKEKAKESPAAVIAEQEKTFRDISEFVFSFAGSVRLAFQLVLEDLRHPG